MEFSEELIKEAERQAAGKPYTLYVKSLKAIGVIAYEVVITNLDRTFKNLEGKEVFIKGNAKACRPVANFSLHEVKAAVKRTQQGVTDYTRFIEEIAAAGVHTYFADLLIHEISYKGKNVSDNYTEVIPVN